MFTMCHCGLFGAASMLCIRRSVGFSVRACWLHVAAVGLCCSKADSWRHTGADAASDRNHNEPAHTGTCTASVSRRPHPTQYNTVLLKPPCFSCSPPAAACKDPLPTIRNGAFPPSCTNSKVGTSCKAQCNTGFAEAGSPVVNCTYKFGTSDTGQWTAPEPALCEKDAVVTGTAYMVSAGDSSSSGAVSACCLGCCFLGVYLGCFSQGECL
jgi:hypothetical protein